MLLFVKVSFVIILAPTVDPKVKIENGSMFGIHRVEDIKKEFYQVLNTTTDPNLVSTFLFFLSDKVFSLVDPFFFEDNGAVTKLAENYICY